MGLGYEEAYWVAIIIMIPNCIPLVQSVANSILQAKNMHRFRSITYIFIALLNVAGTVALVKHYGIIGAAIPTGVSYFIGHGLILNWYYWKKVQLDIPRFWGKVLPIFAVATVLCIVAVLVSCRIDLNNWESLLTAIVVYTVLYILLLWIFVLTREEKKEILGGLIGKRRFL